jgi:PIN domain nuclease of toxin-antitoxin system
VLSSTWRLTFTIEEVAHYLDLPVMAATPDLGDTNSRSDEIALWLRRHPQITTYAIVDDLALDFDDPEQQARFVKTNEEFGLSLPNYRALLRILNPGVAP